jgi:hypothetical protein
VSPDSLLFFCSVTASAATAFALVSLYTHLARRRDDLALAAAATAAGGGDESSEELLPLSRAAPGIPAFMYTRLVRHSGRGAAGWTECAVCLGAIQVGAMVKLLPSCGHAYHRNCIDLWLSSRPTCPLCPCRVGDAGHFARAGSATPPPHPARSQAGTSLKLNLPRHS